MAKKDEVLKHKELGKVVVKQDNRDDGQKLKDFIKENISSMLGSDGEPDLGKIRDILGLSSLNGYELKFPGKGIANALYSAPIYKELKNIDENKSNKINENFIIKGDNLDALKILAKGYTNKIKMIYIDPPYNTMNNDFIYNDNFRADFDAIARISGLIDESGNKSKNLEEMERIFKGTRTHSAWLCFMYPRLKLARDLLKDDGVIFISIDDNEQANLKLLCDEIFGEENFVSSFVWQKKSGGGQAKYFYEGHEYILIYAKKKDLLNGLFKEKTNSKNIETDFIRKIHGKYTNNQKLKFLYEKYPNDIIEHRNLMFEELEIFKNENLIKQEKYDEIKEKLNNGIYFLKPYNEKFNLICKYNDSEISLLYSIIKDVWNSDGATELENLFNGISLFSNPKPTNLLKILINSVCDNNDIILDFFAGSGTTAHAVMAQNLADNGNRKFILVQLDESIDEKKSKTAFEFCKNELKSSKPNISDITIERVKRAKKALNSQM